MQYRQLGKSGLQVSAMTLGTMTFGGGGAFAKVGTTDVAGAKRQIDICRDAGINLIDTADVYSAGRSEEILGEALEGRRDDFLIATKVRMQMGDGPNMEGLSRHHIIRGCEASLKRLRTDHLDLYQVHAWDGLTPIEETLSALEHLVQSGKVRYIGVSNYSGWQLMKTLGISERDRLPRFVSQQIYYSLQERSAEYELLPLACDQGLGTMVWSPLAGGLLSGKYRRNVAAPAGSRQLTDWGEPPVYDQEPLYDTIEVLVEVAEARGVSAAQVALAWLLTRPTVATVIIGARTDEQLRDNLRAVDLQLSDDDLSRLERVSRPRLIYPYWHQSWICKTRFSEADLALHAPFLES